MNGTMWLTHNWTWIAVFALIAALFWLARGAGRRMAPTAADSHHDVQPQDDADSRIDSSVDAQPQPQPNAPPSASAHGHAGHSGRRHGCC